MIIFHDISELFFGLYLDFLYWRFQRIYRKSCRDFDRGKYGKFLANKVRLEFILDKTWAASLKYLEATDAQRRATHKIVIS